MNLSKIPVVRHVAQQILNFEIKHIVICPGSRNAPLTLSLTTHPEFSTYSVVDERSAGFFGLGLSQQLNEPVVLLCTSGSALLNFYPAVAEAFYSRIPLLVISADRPTYQIDIGNGQTIRQNNVFSNHIVFQTSLHQDVIHQTTSILESNTQDLLPSNPTKSQIEDYQEKVDHSNEQKLTEALHNLISKKGPVHINIPIEEPLYEFQEIQNLIARKKKVKLHSESTDFSPFVKSWNEANKIIILVGTLPPNKMSEKTISFLSNDTRVAVLHEISSNIHDNHFISHIDRLIIPIEKQTDCQEIFESLSPELLISIGGMVVSKKIKTMLRKYPPKEHIHIGEEVPYDTYYLGVKHLNTDINDFFDKVKPPSENIYTFQKDWNFLSQKREVAHQKFVKKVPYSDFSVFSKLIKSIPRNLTIQWANSSPIRYAQLFEKPLDSESFCNRGTSGIEGSISTAVGAAVVTERQTLMITGDLSFFYDANALWNSHLPKSFRLIVINNGGGGIFRILPKAKESPGFETFFETKHKRTAKQMAKQYGLSYKSVRGRIGLQWALRRFFSASNRPKLLEIHTPSNKNDEVLMSYFSFLSKHSD